MDGVISSVQIWIAKVNFCGHYWDVQVCFSFQRSQGSEMIACFTLQD